MIWNRIATIIIFLIAFIYERILSPPLRYNQVQIAAGGVLLITMITYNIISIYEIPAFRYLDFLITTPLLLYMLFLYAEVNGWRGNFNILLSANLLLIFIAFQIYLKETLNVYLQLMILMYLIVISEVYSIHKYLHQRGIGGKILDIAVSIIYFGWLGFLFLFSNPHMNNTNLIYNIIDIINKVVYIQLFNFLIT